MAEKIEKLKLLAVEGKDEINFFSALLQHLEIDDIQLEGVGGKYQFRHKIPALIKIPGFSEITSLGIIRDADEDVENAFRSISDLVRRNNLTPPNNPNEFSDANPRVGIFLMPDNANTGMLEDLCLHCIEDPQINPCIDNYISCIEEHGYKPGNLSKAKSQVYLAAMSEIANSVGVGAQKGYWDFNSPSLSQLIDFLKGI